jgi:hypothetical protein
MRNTLTDNLLKNKKGVALITVVGVTFFMSLMTATLVVTHSSNFALMLDSANQKQAYLAASSGLDYAKCRLSQDRRLGTGTQSTTTTTLGDLTIVESDDGKKLTGEFVGSVPQRGFEVRVENLLSSASPDSSRGLPAHCIVLKVHGNCGTFQSNTETVLVEAPLYDSAAISNKAMDMHEVTKWTIDSTDPLRNWIRSNEDIVAPDFFKNSDSMKFLNSKDGCPLPGVAWSKKDIGIGQLTRDGNGNVTSRMASRKDPSKQVANTIDGESKDDAYTNTNGQMAPHATLNYNAYDLKLGDLQRPNPTLEVEVPAGTFDLHKTPVTYTKKTFTWVQEHHWGGGYWATKTENIRQDMNDLVYTPPGTGQTPIHYLQVTAETPIINETPPFNPSNPWQSGHAGENGWTYTEISQVKKPPAANTVEVLDNKVNVANNFSSPELQFDFNGAGAGKPVFKATSALPLHVTGDLTVKANRRSDLVDTATGAVELPAEVPNFTFGDVAATEGNFGFIYASEKSLKPIGAKDPGAKPYSISLQGTVNGKGAVAATGDLTLGGNSKVEADIAHEKNVGLVLWSGRNITFDVEDKGTMAFKGLVYGKNDVNLQFKNKDNTATTGKLTSLDLEGALVAQSGGIHMGDADSVSMKYNNKYLNLFTTGLPENTARFAQVSFKSF